LAEELLFRIRLDSHQKLTIHVNLVFLPLVGDDVSRFLLLEYFTFAVTNFFGLFPAKVIVVEVVRNIDPGNVNLCLGGDDVDLVDSPQRAPVDAEGSSDQEKARRQLLQEDDALSLVNAGEEDQDGAGSDGRTQLAVVLAEGLLVGGLSFGSALRGQSARRLLKLNDALLAILLPANLFRQRRRLGYGNFLLRLFVLNEGGFLVVHLRPRKPHNSSIDQRVSRRMRHSSNILLS